MTTNIYTRLLTSIAGIFLLSHFHAFAVTRTTIASGNWSSSSVWSPPGVPAAGDNAIIATGNTITVDTNTNITQMTVNSGGTMAFVANKKLIILGSFTVNGTVTMNGGNIALLVPNSSFTLGANSIFIWDPGANDAADATLFTNGKENFASTSTLIIKKWYNYTTLPLGSVVTGNFGNLVINTNSSGTILEWNQNNQFETHQILGTLTVDQGWVTLDKSGAISNTTIGNIVLTSVNSYFTAYSGSAAPNFTLTTSSINNKGGTFFGIYDGKGNVTLNVTGNFTNLGNVKLIDNDGLGGSGACNGNPTLIVGGTYSQSAGDTRIIYNLYSTVSGSYTAKIGTLNLTGGIFMGQYSCSTIGVTSSFNVANCTINMPNSTDKFRCVGLSSMSTNVNNQKLNFTVGNLTISGNGAAEFTTNASSGDETDSITGNFQINSCLNSFNYGGSMAPHNTTLTVGGDVTVNGGTTFLSRIPGKLTSTINGNFTLTNGTFIIKGDIGAATLAVNGTFNQTGGKLFHHSNYSTPTSDVVSVTLNGDFNQSSGFINFDDCASSTAVHLLNINGSNYNLSGTGLITGNNVSVFNEIHFINNGITQFNRESNSQLILHAKQYIDNGCTLNVALGNIQLFSSNNAGNYFLTVSTGGTLNMNTHQLFSNGTGANCAIKVDSGGTIKTGCPYGLYDGTTNACISNGANLAYYLDPNSIVEYNGTASQAITDGDPALTVSANQKYGVLRINSNAAQQGTYLNSSNVYVRTQLQLVNGELDLNGNTLTVESGLSSAITRTKGYIKSETNTPYNPSIVDWKNISIGTYIFPFGVNANGYIPVTFFPVSGGGDVSISTRATTPDNNPLPLTVPSDSSAVNLGTMDPVKLIIDRWWVISAPGLTADVIISYLGSENTMADTSATGSLSLKQWNGSSWTNMPTIQKGVTSGVGTASISNTNLFSAWMINGQPVVPSVPLSGNTDMNEHAGNFKIHEIGPNPFNDNFNINYTIEKQGPVTIQMTDVAGKIIHSEEVSGVKGSNSYTFTDKYNLKPGIYFFNITYQGTTTTNKMVKN